MEFRNPVGVVQAGATVAAEVLEVTQTAPVPAGATETVLFYAATGHFWRVRSLRMSADPPPGATTGTHEVMAGVGTGITTAQDADVIATSTWADALRIGSADEIAPLAVWPPDLSARIAALQALVATDTIPVAVRYANLTDAAQSAARRYRVVVERVRV